MILQPGSHSRQMMTRGNAECGKAVRIAYAGTLQNRRRTIAARRQNDLSRGGEGDFLTILADLQARGPAALEEDPVDQRAGKDR